MNTQVQKICIEIERRIELLKKLKKNDFTEGSIDAHKGILILITSLQHEQPEVDLDAEIAIYLNKNVLNRINNYDIIEDFTTMEAGELARHFYELGKNARKEE